ncbi:MAG: SpoIID/LytB domain-containing protein [Bacteroidota bacterium]|nr:SpoIID/LytB domain-containing protein [Bacteroidota bacterium]
MLFKYIAIEQLVFFLISLSVPAREVRIRLFAARPAASAIFTVTYGKYKLETYDDHSVPVSYGEPVLLAMMNGKITVKPRLSPGFICDSLTVKGLTGDDRFELRVNGTSDDTRKYSGDLKCISDLGIILLINTCNVEDYISGVVRAEAGEGRKIEYLKSQALLVRTYLYKNLSRHLLDGYNLCDNIHCQAFSGITDDTAIIRATLETRDLVVLDRDSVLIFSAFHSNCGGETSASEGVWLQGHSYLKKVIDPYCTNSRNASWRKSIPIAEWTDYLRRSGFVPKPDNKVNYNFTQLTRLEDYRIGSFTLPFRQIRNDLNLRSSFFSVQVLNDSVILKGRGYGHGVGLCQEGAMSMASKGFNFRQIIKFYFSGIIITDVKNSKKEINIL